jgi:hypothetical protein
VKEFGSTALSADAARQPRVHSARVAFTVREPDLIPEGITHDPRTRVFFLGSVAKRKIVRVDAEGRAADFVPTGRDGLGRVLGVHVDAGRRLLWAVSNPQRFKGGKGDGALFGFDVDTAALRHKLAAPGDGARRVRLNDVALGPRGELFVTASEVGGVYLATDASEGVLRPLLAPGSLSGPNGIVFFEEAGLLLVAHDVGVASVDPRTGAFRDLAKRPDQVLGSFDGLALRGRTLLGVQNGIGAPRVVQVEFDGAGASVVSLRTLEAGSPELELPTTGVRSGDAFYVIGNSQLRALGPDGRVREPGSLRDVRVLAIPLSAK